MNGYFQLVGQDGKTWLKLYPPTDGGDALDVADVIDYLNFHKLVYDLPALNKAVSELSAETAVLLNNDELIPVNEEMFVTIDADRMCARGRFTCASDKGKEITKDEILSDLKYKGIKFGIDECAIDFYLMSRMYNQEIILANGQPAIQGKNASIEYFFNTDLHVRPTLNEDGSVDFFNLNIINHVEKGQLLARLTKEVKGTPGKDIMGGVTQPAKVNRKILKYGKNISINEDGTEIFAECDGHVMLTGGRVFVGNVMEVENVDPSTGNIVYEGNVQVNGNVCSNFSVKAKGNVEVKGVVEGAEIEAGGNITIARGMNGMGKGVLKSEGNIIAKFIENSTVEAAGYVESGSIMHSNVVAGTEVHVGGKKGFISGGKVNATSLIEAKILGSEMGTNTILEIGLSAVAKKRYKEVTEQIEEIDKVLSRAVPIMEAARDRIADGQELSEEQLDNVKNIYNLSKIKLKEQRDLKSEQDELGLAMETDKDASIRVTDIVYPGTQIVISDVSKMIKESVQHCKFVKSQGNVKMLGL